MFAVEKHHKQSIRQEEALMLRYRHRYEGKKKEDGE